jgi:hypothetical protein
MVDAILDENLEKHVSTVSNVKISETSNITALLIYVKSLRVININGHSFKNSIYLECPPGFVAMGSECLPFSVTGGPCIHPSKLLKSLLNNLIANIKANV